MAITAHTPATPSTLASAATLPAAWYHDPLHHERELRAVFGRGWSCVGVTDDVAGPGSHVATVTGSGLPVVVVRDTAGALRGFVNVCRHRGGPLAEGCGNG